MLFMKKFTSDTGSKQESKKVLTMANYLNPGIDGLSFHNNFNPFLSASYTAPVCVSIKAKGPPANLK